MNRKKCLAKVNASLARAEKAEWDDGVTVLRRAVASINDKRLVGGRGWWCRQVRRGIASMSEAAVELWNEVQRIETAVSQTVPTEAKVIEGNLAVLAMEASAYADEGAYQDEAPAFRELAHKLNAASGNLSAVTHNAEANLERGREFIPAGREAAQEALDAITLALDEADEFAA